MQFCVAVAIGYHYITSLVVINIFEAVRSSWSKKDLMKTFDQKQDLSSTNIFVLVLISLVGLYECIFRRTLVFCETVDGTQC